jgi:hypothetical protein
MKYYAILVLGIAASCGSLETRKTISYLYPKSIRLGGSLSQISRELGIDTTGYRTISTIGHIKGQYKSYQMKKYTLSPTGLERISLDDNLYDSIHLTFYEDFLYSVSFYLSNNQKIEILKFRLNTRNRFLAGDSSFSGTKIYALDSSFHSAGYRGLTYSYTRNKISFFYEEDILENVAVLNIQNLRMKRLFR